MIMMDFQQNKLDLCFKNDRRTKGTDTEDFS